MNDVPLPVSNQNILTRQKDHKPYQAQKQKAAAATADDDGHKDHAQWWSYLGWEGADSK